MNKQTSISSELISVVLGVTASPTGVVNNILYYTQEEKHSSALGSTQVEHNINVHEFACKCKEWALSEKGPYKQIISGIGEEENSAFAVIDNEVPVIVEECKNPYDCKSVTKYEDKYFGAKTEPDAIFKACNYLLKKY